jgi:hypothetical protein
MNGAPGGLLQQLLKSPGLNLAPEVRAVQSPHGDSLPSITPWHVFHHYRDLQSPTTLPGSRQCRTLPGNHPALSSGWPLQASCLRRHARSRSPYVTPQGTTLERVMGLIKGGFSHRLASRLPVWQRGFTDHRIRNAEDLETRRNYLHMNPVRGNLIVTAEQYPYSSAYRPTED